MDVLFELSKSVKVFVSPAKQKRDICIAFPAAAFNFETWPTFHGSLTNVKFLRLGHFLGNYKG